MQFSTLGLPLLMLLFCLSRALFWMVGVHFSADSLGWYFQYVDPPLLKHRLFESLLYLHSQPPLFNLYLGTVLKLFGVQATLLFHLCSIACGGLLAFSLYRLLTAMDVRNKIAFYFTLIFIVSPCCIAYENLLFYTYPIAVILCLAALVLYSFCATDGRAAGVTFFLLLAAVTWLQSLFHLVWFIAVVAGIAMIKSPAHQLFSRKTLVLALPGLIISLFPYLKNWFLFGFLGTSSWIGLSLATMTIQHLPEQDIQRYHQEGLLSSASLEPIMAVDSLERFSECRNADPSPIAILEQSRKSSGVVSFHHSCVLDVSRQYMADALWVIANRPEIYLQAILRNLLTFYSRASSDYGFVAEAINKISLWDRFYAAVLYGRILYRNDSAPMRADLRTLRNKLEGRAFFLFIALPLLTLYGIILLGRSCLRTGRRSSPQAGVLFFVVTSIVYVTAAANMLNFGEAQRIRFVLDPFFVLLLATAVQRICKRRAIGAAPT